MANHGARKQKQLAKQKAKRAQKRTQLARQSSNDPTIRLAECESWPIIECLVPDDLWSRGLGQLIIARRMPDGKFATGVYLVDTFCMGVKNAFWRVATVPEYDTLVERIEGFGPLLKVSPEYFSKLVLCAADYAQSLGIPPHPDFRHARSLLDGIDPALCHDRFEFGQDGKPLYIGGPNESPAQSRSIAERISRIGGHFIVPAAGPHGELGSLVAPDDDSFDDDFDDEDDVPQKRLLS